ncbi:adenosylcobinamide amidohydrolase [Methylocystis sp. ATCC 49242]|uniref:adenosylcobinamide amidohydrolase n=1 Tax=Methylocystis sp. ATCC 49242 TaxID=622637 RepID=UPI0001F86872|nr:adenosylcobinamide amidohydrolase [Methylocystis sp. ATCC 49242]
MKHLPFRLELRHPLLIVRFEAEQRILGWSLTKPGFARTRDVVWLEVRDADLGPHVDPLDFVRTKLSAQELDDAAAFMTAREIARHHMAQSRIGTAIVTCVTTVGLTNGEKVGERRGSHDCVAGTINTLVHVSHALSPGAFVESISIATQSRTAAIMDTNKLRDGLTITGTGTDCIIVAAPEIDAPETRAGLHTDLGEAIGAAVYDATYAGAAEWSVELDNH